MGAILPKRHAEACATKGMLWRLVSWPAAGREGRCFSLHCALIDATWLPRLVQDGHHQPDRQAGLWAGKQQAGLGGTPQPGRQRVGWSRAGQGWAAVGWSTAGGSQRPPSAWAALPK